MPYVPRQYDSAIQFRGHPSMPNIIDDMDAQRILSYDLYDDFYYNRPETFKVTLRGDSDVEIYLPSTKKMVNATARFLAVDFDFTLKGGAQDAVENYLRGNLFPREEIMRRFIRGKRSLLARGDLVWYITANPNKPEGKRLTINTIHPSSVFPIEDDNEEHIVGWYIVDIVHDPRDKEGDQNKQVARRQKYSRDRNGQITYEAGTFEIGAWDERNLKKDEIKPVSVITQQRLLPPDITAFPIYHIPNHEPDGSTWGTSLLAGVEYIVNALNQSMTYEDLSLVLQGLGVYVSTAGPPLDPNTQKPGKYKLHPGNVVEIEPGDDFRRVTGVATVSPFSDHIGALDRWAMDGAGIPDMATGAIEVSVAQSGIALALKMGPIIAENSDRELALGGKWDQMGYDLIHGWLPAFEGLTSTDTVFKSIFGDPMPVNRDTYINEVVNLVVMNLITLKEARVRLEKVGYEFTEGIVDELYEQMSRRAIAMTGEFYAGELGAGAGRPPPNPFEAQESYVRSRVNGEG